MSAMYSKALRDSLHGLLSQVAALVLSGHESQMLRRWHAWGATVH